MDCLQKKGVLKKRLYNPGQNILEQTNGYMSGAPPTPTSPYSSI